MFLTILVRFLHCGLNCASIGGYALSQDDPSDETVWELIQNQMNTTLTNTFNASDAIALRCEQRASKDTLPTADL